MEKFLYRYLGATVTIITVLGCKIRWRVMVGIVTVDFASDALPATVQVRNRSVFADIGIATFTIAALTPVDLSSCRLTVIVHHSTTLDERFDVIPPNHKVRFDTANSLPITAVTISSALIDRTFKRMQASFRHELPALTGVNDSKVADLVRDLRTLAPGSSHFERLRFELTAAQLILHLFERYGVDSGPCPIQGGLGAARRRRVLDHIDAHLGEDISLKALAREAGLSRHHFAKAFKAGLGMSPHRYIGERRVHRAKELLLDRSRSITDVALDLGFASHSHFTDTFRKATGITPSRYRKDRI